MINGVNPTNFGVLKKVEIEHYSKVANLVFYN